MERFPQRGTKVTFVAEGNGNKLGVVESVAIIDGQEVAIVKTAGDGKTVKVPCMSLTRV